MGAAVIAPIRDAVAEACGLRPASDRPPLTAMFPRGACDLRDAATGETLSAKGLALAIDGAADPVILTFVPRGAGGATARGRRRRS